MRTFVAAVEAGSFTAAAERLGYSKKLVSKYVGELESRLGVRLFHRTTRKLSLTAEGQRYYPRSVALLEELEAVETGLREEMVGLTGELRISAPINFGELYVRPLIQSFVAENPGLSIDLRLSDQFADLADEGLDLAIRIGRLSDSRLIARRLASTEVWIVASPRYVERAGAPRSPQELTDHTCIRDTNIRSGSAWMFEINRTLKRIPIKGAFAVNSARVARDLAIAGEGIAYCPDYLAAGAIAEGRLVRLFEHQPVLTLHVHAVYLDARFMPTRTRRFIDFLSERFARRSRWQDLQDFTVADGPRR